MSGVRDSSGLPFSDAEYEEFSRRGGKLINEFRKGGSNEGSFFEECQERRDRIIIDQKSKREYKEEELGIERCVEAKFYEGFYSMSFVHVLINWIKKSGASLQNDLTELNTFDKIIDMLGNPVYDSDFFCKLNYDTAELQNSYQETKYGRSGSIPLLIFDTKKKLLIYHKKKKPSRVASQEEIKEGCEPLLEYLREKEEH